MNAGEVSLDFEGVPLTIDGDYVQTSAGTLRAHVGRADDEYIPSALEVDPQLHWMFHTYLDFGGGGGT